MMIPIFNPVALLVSALCFGLLLQISFEKRILLLNQLLKTMHLIQSSHFTEEKLRHRNLTKVTQLEGGRAGTEALASSPGQPLYHLTRPLTALPAGPAVPGWWPLVGV